MTVPALFTSRWANRELGDLECQPVGISRGTPRFPTGYRYRLARELAPGDRAWAEQDVGRFRAAYLHQIRDIGAAAILDRLERLSGGLPVVLLCYEDVRAGEGCHRRYLADFLLSEAGVEVPELGPGMLARRPDAPQPALFD